MGRIECSRSINPTGPFTILEPRDQEIGEFYIDLKHLVTYFEVPKL